MNKRKTDALPDCCKPQKKPENRQGLMWGILYGIIPHTFCILFLLFSVIGATSGAVYFQKFFRIPHLFQFLVLASFIFATISAVIYLKRINALSFSGVKLKWQYLTILFTTTIAINLLLFYVILPSVANLKNENNKVASQNVATDISTGVQVIQMDQMAGGYFPNSFTIKKGVPVKWIINSKAPDTCSGSVAVPKLGIRRDLVKGENIIEFTPKEVGEIKFSCIMGMYSGKFIVN